MRLAQNDLPALAERFYRTASGELDDFENSYKEIGMAEVQTAFLLAHYQYTYLPVGSASHQYARAVRWAYTCNLHQVEKPRPAPRDESDHTVDDEEKRCLWWALWAMDTFASQMSSLPPSIEDGSSSTLLPSCQLSELAIGNFPPSTTRSLDDNREEKWYNQRPGETQGVKAQLVRLSATAIAREMSSLIRLRQAKPTVIVQGRLDRLEKQWYCMISGLSPEFLCPQYCSVDLSVEGHRLRLEALHLVHVTGLLSGIPPLRPLMMERGRWPNRNEASYNYETRWGNSISHALQIVALYRHGNWPSQAFLEGDAITLFPILWTAASFLTLALMRSGPVDATEKIALLDALDLVMAQLTQASRHWGIAEIFLSSLKELRGLSYFKLDMNTIFRLVLGIYSPLKQDTVEREEPKGSLDLIVAEDDIFRDDEHSETTSSQIPSDWTGEDVSSFIDWSGGNPSIQGNEWCGPEIIHKS
ncbi:fungal specific transcription factor [Colletotrichum kahawae]|uniref:Fungal specific transcription factor n=1 Tax=Colletotrichum kahawae TaxID=34407 RepID=A0AAD9Y3L0_COLKA|nr:fungal specific transcription factor [Colletotrichum kahawae]